jgi:cysteine desulfurase/selenocysteine lyase
VKRTIEAEQIRDDFPIFKELENRGPPLIYLDNSATTQKPACVIETMTRFYSSQNANVHRSFYDLGQNATQAYENTRARIARFIHAREATEIVFVRGATEAINHISTLYTRSKLKTGDELLISEAEHHSNLIPWLMRAKEQGLVVKTLPLDPEGNFQTERLPDLLTSRTKIVSITQVSNVLGTVAPIQSIVKEAHRAGAVVLVDAAQALAHMPIDVQDLDCDFLVGSGHKMYGPMGIGFFYGKRDILESLPPYHGGSNMMEDVSFSDFSPSGLPHRFEAGTPDVAGVLGLGSAIGYLETFGWEEIIRWEEKVTSYVEQRLREKPWIRVVGRPQNRASVLSFRIEGIHPHDIAMALSAENIAVRAGHHCCQPLMKKLQLRGGTVRVSLGIYNTPQEGDRLMAALQRAYRFFNP